MGFVDILYNIKFGMVLFNFGNMDHFNNLAV